MEKPQITIDTSDLTLTQDTFPVTIVVPQTTKTTLTDVKAKIDFINSEIVLLQSQLAYWQSIADGIQESLSQQVSPPIQSDQQTINQ